MKGRKAAFVDRDGVINADRAYVHHPAQFSILPGVAPALRLLAARDHALVVVTNQSGIARGLYSELVYERLTEHMRAVLAREDKEEGELVVMSRKGQVIKLPLKDVPSLGRDTQGVRIMKLRAGDAIASTVCF